MRATFVQGSASLRMRSARWGLAALGLLMLISAGRAGDPRRNHIVSVVDRVKGSVVNIHSERTVRGPAVEELLKHKPLQNRVNGMGTGIVIDPRGYVVTNFHVVEDVSTLRVRLGDRTTYPARVIARDKPNDLALIKVDLDRMLPVIPIGTAEDLMVGEDVIAIGNAYGYDYTVTRGIVSAVKRDVSLNREISYKSLIQTDASINPGNSGGPLLNIHGELVGVNVAIRAGAQGISFAIPVETVIKAAASMFRARNQNLWHGIVPRDEVTSGEDYRVRRSLVVGTIETGSPADKAGFRAGDLIVKIGNEPTRCTLDLERCVFGHAAGDLLPITYRRDGSVRTADLVLARHEHAPVTKDVVWTRLGVKFKQASTRQVSTVNKQLNGGLEVVDVRGDSTAAKAGIKPGDILIGLHQWETVTLENVIFVLSHRDLATFQPLSFYLVRAGQIHRGWLHQLD